jgi:hypothetical protein
VARSIHGEAEDQGSEGAEIMSLLDNGKVLNDTDPMPWGLHQGTPMQDVPARYMFWLWTAFGLEKDKSSQVGGYIRRNLSAFEKDYPDGIWR